MAAPVRPYSPAWSSIISEDFRDLAWKFYPDEKPPSDGFYLTLDSGAIPPERILRYERNKWVTPEVSEIKVTAWKHLPASREPSLDANEAYGGSSLLLEPPHSPPAQ